MIEKTESEVRVAKVQIGQGFSVGGSGSGSGSVLGKRDGEDFGSRGDVKKRKY